MIRYIIVLWISIVFLVACSPQEIDTPAFVDTSQNTTEVSSQITSEETPVHNLNLEKVSSPKLTQVVPEVLGIKTEILQFPDPVPVRKNEPWLRGLLYYPEAGINTHSPAIIIIHGGLAGHPARQVGAPRFAAERYAKMGYTVFSPVTRHSRDEFRTKFENINIDIKASIDALQARGHQNFILAGHSMGSVRISYYQAETQDPRVKALIHFAPTADMGGKDSIASSFIPDYEEKVRIAEAAVAAGGSNINLSGGATQDEIRNNSGIINMVGGYFYTAESFLSHWGPEAKSRNSDLMPKNTVPIFMMAGEYDGAVPEGRMEKLKSLAVNSPRVDFIRYKNTNHFFEGYWDKSVEDTVGWLAELDLAPSPRVNIEVIDARMGNGRHLPGILYTPERGSDPSKPTFILQHGWTGNTIYSSNHWLAERLVKEGGYTVLAPQTRVSGPPGSHRSVLAEYAADLGHWIDAMEKHGHGKIILEGHSMGGVWVSNYMSLTDDKRVVGMVYLAPTRDVAEYLRGGLGEERYTDAYRRMSEAVQRGDGDVDFNFEKFRVPNVNPETGPVSATLTLAKTFMEYHGPETRAVHTERVKEFSRPSLSIAGRKDLLMTDEFINKFVASHQGDAQVLWYENGSHGLRESKNRVTEDVIAWTKATFE